MSALDSQVGGGHYKELPIQPVEFCHKNGKQDLEKAIHFLKLLIEMEYPE